MSTPLFYSPAENHLGIIYSSRFGHNRFKMFVTQNEHIIHPDRHPRYYLLKEINLGSRAVRLSFSDIFSADRVLLKFDLKVSFRFDPRDAVPDNFIQALNLSSKALENIINANIGRMLRNEVIIQKNAEDILFSHVGKRELQRILSSRIAEQVRDLGISINPSFGVSIVNVQPDKIYLKAVQEEAVAEAQSRAAQKRLASSLGNVSAEQALQILYTQIASAIVKTGNIPEKIYVEKQTREQNDYVKRKKISPKTRLKSTREYDLPFVE